MEFNEFNNHITIFQYKHNGPYPNDIEEKELYSCFCKIYNSSNKDIEILKNKGSKLAFSLIMRSAYPEYMPENNHIIKVDDKRYDDIFNIEEIRNDTPNKGYITLVLSEK
ncbi:hypothetical protein EKQ61_01555 [Staphylococcus gallinarum]|uniref:Phage head-tail adapter protein n=1 Tax=Staphylococcus gallinarum TaxID=1293 RepID=A0ABQ0Y012_STAGA|nr:hypothetical protein [Staphylococcus gallinarum]KIR10673.1 phage protein [Staphylococcus gallinarum]RTX82889.1 hypothetical protein EKQ61_01555 [Staphylococcus gallinarum]GEQ04565.1 hypothetical protein SGA02_03930 [Staphylococcus gallinarum]